MYLALWQFGKSENRKIVLNSGIPNNGFVACDEMTESTLKSDVKLRPNGDATILIQTDLNQQPKNETIEMYTIDSVEVDSIKEMVQPINVSVTVENKNVQRSQLDVNKFDEISSADDIKESCIEKREPNGTTYFVEINPNRNSISKENSSNSSSDSYCDAIEQNIMEKVLNQKDVELKHDTMLLPAFHDVYLFDESESDEEEREVKAVVHVSNDTHKQDDIDSMEIKTNSSLTELKNDDALHGMVVTKPGTIKSIDTCKSPKFQIGVYEAIPKQKLLFENDSERMAFKTRLENLFGQNDNQKTDKSLDGPPNRVNRPFLAKRFDKNYSNSAPESLVLSMVNDDSASKSQSDKTIDDTPTNIPAPPVFNQQLYDTVGRHNKNPYKTMLSTPTSNEIDIENSPKVLDPSNTNNDSSSSKKANLSRSQAHENLTMIGQCDETDENSEATANESESIKQKLEEIFSRGGRNDDVNMETDGNHDNIRRSKRIEPFDTVARQKVIFNTVLKSIGPENSTKLRRVSSTASVELHKF